MKIRLLGGIRPEPLPSKSSKSENKWKWKLSTDTRGIFSKFVRKCGFKGGINPRSLQFILQKSGKAKN